VSRFPLSAMLTSLPLDFESAIRCVAELGFTHVDVVALAERPESHRAALAETGLIVACASLGRGLPEGHGLEVASLSAWQATVELVKRQIADAATLGATRAYLVPPTDSDLAALERFATGCSLLAGYAAGRMVRLCVEPVPGRALSSAALTLSWLETTALEQLSLLLDVGHCLITSEDPAAVIRRAGRRLGHVHLDDNDGVGDLHWPLLTGRLTRDVLINCVDALAESGYESALAFEFHAQLADPVAALREGKRLLEGQSAAP
jgi:sugar phosphate isomerase/epimerase